MTARSYALLCPSKKMTEKQISKWIRTLEMVEADLQNLKEEYLMVMIHEQQKLVETKYDRKDYHRHVTQK